MGCSGARAFFTFDTVNGSKLVDHEFESDRNRSSSSSLPELSTPINAERRTRARYRIPV